MHAITEERLKEIIAYYRQQKELAGSMELRLSEFLTQKEIDGYKVLGLLRQAAADLRGLKAP